jgi:hypothetical protein
MGDSIACVSGEAFAMINPGSQSGGYMLKPKAPVPADGKTVSTLHLNPQTTMPIQRGHISAGADIGTIMTSGGSFTR